MAPKRGRGAGRTGGRGKNESQVLVQDLEGQGLSKQEVRDKLKDMGYADSRRSQLMKFYTGSKASTVSTTQTGAASDEQVTAPSASSISRPVEVSTETKGYAEEENNFDDAHEEGGVSEDDQDE